MITIRTKPDMKIDPGHQWLVLPDTPQGHALALLLAQHLTVTKDGDHLLVPHTFVVDTAIVDLIDALAHVRFSAPHLVQFSLMSAPAVENVAEEDGLEGS